MDPNPFTHGADHRKLKQTQTNSLWVSDCSPKLRNTFTSRTSASVSLFTVWGQGLSQRDNASQTGELVTEEKSQFSPVGLRRRLRTEDVVTTPVLLNILLHLIHYIKHDTECDVLIGWFSITAALMTKVCWEFPWHC